MTHTLHRRGSVADLHEDYVLLIFTAKGINREGSEEKMRRIWEVISRYEKDLVNFGNHNPDRDGAALYDMEALKQAKSRIAHAVFRNRDRLKECLRELKDGDFGISVVVSGLYDEVRKICREVGLRLHTVNQSLGIHGKTEKLPDNTVLEIHTMCGHAMVSPHLIDHMVRQIKDGEITCAKAAGELSRMCDCGIFNNYRAEKLLKRLTADENSLSPDR
jgi:hypothetical protein